MNYPTATEILSSLMTARGFELAFRTQTDGPERFEDAETRDTEDLFAEVDFEMAMERNG